LPDGFFKPKIPIRAYFGGPYIDGKMFLYFMAIWSILRTFGIFYDHLVHFVFIWYTYIPVLVSCTKKNLATLLQTRVTRWFCENITQSVAQPIFPKLVQGWSPQVNVMITSIFDNLAFILKTNIIIPFLQNLAVS
jgi:hypothetical protein